VTVIAFQYNNRLLTRDVVLGIEIVLVLEV